MPGEQSIPAAAGRVAHELGEGVFQRTHTGETTGMQKEKPALAAPLKVRGDKRLPREGVDRILIRGTNWIGDAVMTLPAVAAIRKTWPQARIALLAKPWVADIYREAGDVDNLIIFEEPGRHAGPMGKLLLAQELRERRYAMAILLQNAIEAAIIARLARIPLRAGYDADARGWLLTHAVQRTKAARRVHQIHYYLEMVKALGCLDTGPELCLALRPATRTLADPLLPGAAADSLLVGMAPGAAYGPAKRWPAERFAAVAATLLRDYPEALIVLLGSERDREATDVIAATMPARCLNLAGRTSVREVMAVIARCRVFLTNDSGLMHIAGALNVPTVAIFGSTNPDATSPPGGRNIIIRKPVDCSPCLKTVCPTDFRCMKLIDVAEVAAAINDVLAERTFTTREL